MSLPKKRPAEAAFEHRQNRSNHPLKPKRFKPELKQPDEGAKKRANHALKPKRSKTKPKRPAEVAFERRQKRANHALEPKRFKIELSWENFFLEGGRWDNYLPLLTKGFEKMDDNIDDFKAWLERNLKKNAMFKVAVLSRFTAHASGPSPFPPLNEESTHDFKLWMRGNYWSNELFAQALLINLNKFTSAWFFQNPMESHTTKENAWPTVKKNLSALYSIYRTTQPCARGSQKSQHIRNYSVWISDRAVELWGTYGCLWRAQKASAMKSGPAIEALIRQIEATPALRNQLEPLRIKVQNQKHAYLVLKDEERIERLAIVKAYQDAEMPVPVHKVVIGGCVVDSGWKCLVRDMTKVDIRVGRSNEPNSSMDPNRPDRVFKALPRSDTQFEILCDDKIVLPFGTLIQENLTLTHNQEFHFSWGVPRTTTHGVALEECNKLGSLYLVKDPHHFNYAKRSDKGFHFRCNASECKKFLVFDEGVATLLKELKGRLPKPVLHVIANWFMDLPS